METWETKNIYKSYRISRFQPKQICFVLAEKDKDATTVQIEGTLVTSSVVVGHRG